MSHKRVVRFVLRAASRLLPQRLHTPGLRARTRVLRLTREERARLQDNLRAMLRPETA